MAIGMDYREFLCDELFVYWRIHPTKELDIYWENFLLENGEVKESFNEAMIAFEVIRSEKDTHQRIESSSLQTLRERIETGKRKKLRILQISSAVAVMLLFLLSTLFIMNKKTENMESDFASIGEVINNNNIQLITGENILDIDNNSTLNLSEKKHSALISNSLTQKEIDLHNTQMNKLIVPYGKRSTLVLADGSKVQLNSGTKLEFPSMFSERKREINVEGEIFIEVEKQNNIPFIIHTSHSQITVHGTSFNVSSYTEDKSESVVLVNGAVEVKSQSSTLQLQANEMAVIENGIIRHKTVDVSDYISWTSGYIQFNKSSLSDVLKKIGRYYNVEFQYNPELDLNDQTCSGKLFLSENLDDVLEAFSKMTYLEYENQGNETIFIRQ